MKWNLAAVGGFVLISLATLVVALAILSGRTGPTDTYYTLYTNVTGLKFGSQVLYEGYPIGQVEHIDPVEESGHMSFRVEFSVTQGWRIPDDSLAMSTASGLLAPQTIAIVAGKSTTSLSPGDMIKPAPSSDLMSAVSSMAGNVDTLTSQGLLPLIDNLNRQVTALGAIIEGDLKPLAKNASNVVGTANQYLPSILRNADGAAANLQSVSGRLGEVLSEDRVKRLDLLIDNAADAVGQVDGVMKDLKKLSGEGGEDLRVGLQEFRFSMEALSRRAGPIAENLDSTARNLQDFSRQLRQNPGLLLGGRDAADTEPPLRQGKRNP